MADDKRLFLTIANDLANVNNVLSKMAEIGKDELSLDELFVLSEFGARYLDTNIIIESAEKLAHEDPVILQNDAREYQEQLSRERYRNILNKFICEAQSAIQAFAFTQRYKFNESECKFMYFGIIAQCIKEGLSPSDATQREKATKHLTDGIQWGDVWQETARSAVSNWVRMYAAKAEFNDSVTDYVLSFVDHMSCSQESYESLMGSNGCADQLTNWDGSQKQGLGAAPTPTRKPGGRKI